MVIGYSVSGRPLEVYTFGNGEKQRMIVAGIHGGYEWNTIALADELITHINDNPEYHPKRCDPLHSPQPEPRRRRPRPRL